MKSFLEELTQQYHDTLNPLLFDGFDMKESIREKLLSIGKEWAKFAKIPEDAIYDIEAVGGNMNYSYTPFSDIDVHLEVDMTKIPIGSEYLDDYLYDKKVLWAYKNKDVTVMGYPVELYAANYEDPPKSDQGVYSLMDDHWIQRPEKKKIRDFENDEALNQKIDILKKEIEDILSGECSDPVAAIYKMKEKLHNMRSAGIAEGGEFSDENLAYKELRNLSYIDRMNDYLQKKKTEALSI